MSLGTIRSLGRILTLSHALLSLDHKRELTVFFIIHGA